MSDAVFYYQPDDFPSGERVAPNKASRQVPITIRARTDKHILSVIAGVGKFTNYKNEGLPNATAANGNFLPDEIALRWTGTSTDKEMPSRQCVFTALNGLPEKLLREIKPVGFVNTAVECSMETLNYGADITLQVAGTRSIQWYGSETLQYGDMLMLDLENAKADGMVRDYRHGPGGSKLLPGLKKVNVIHETEKFMNDTIGEASGLSADGLKTMISDDTRQYMDPRSKAKEYVYKYQLAVLQNNILDAVKWSRKANWLYRKYIEGQIVFKALQRGYQNQTVEGIVMPNIRG